jgi:hypothetical protein
MVDYVLTVQSDPTGIEINVSALGLTFWRVTPFTKTYPSGTVIVLTAPRTVGEALGCTELGWYFKEWKDNGAVVGSEVNLEVTLASDLTRKAYFEQQLYFPTRHPERRSSKFEGKADEEVMQLRTIALKTMMVDQQGVTSAQQDRFERTVGDYLMKQGLYGSEMHHYRNFSQELYGLGRMFKSETLNKEASLKAEKWKTRGLTEEHLTAVAKLFGITLTFA